MKCLVSVHFVVMGLREKVALAYLTLTLTQLICGHCMPRTQRKTLLKSNLNDLKQDHANNPIPSPPVQANTNSKCLNIRNAPPGDKSVFKTYNFPETEYPTDMSPINLFNYGIHNDKPTDVVRKRTSNSQTEALVNDFKKEMKLKRKLNSIKTENSQSKREMTPDPLSHCFRDTGTFPEVQYPMSAMETWAPHYWNPTPFYDKDQQFDAFELALQNTNEPTNAKPTGIQRDVFSKKFKPEIGKITFAKSKPSNKTNQVRENVNTTVSSTSESASQNTSVTGKPTSILSNTLNSSNTTPLSVLETDINVTKKSVDALQLTSNNTNISISFTPPLTESCPANLNTSATFDSEQDMADLVMNIRNSDLLEAISLLLSSNNLDSLHSSPIPLPYKITVQDIDICPAFDNGTSDFNDLIQIDHQPFDKKGSCSEAINANLSTATYDSAPFLIKFPLPLLAGTITDTTPDFLEYALHNDTLPILERSLDSNSPQTSLLPEPNKLNINLSQSGSIRKIPEHTKISNTIQTSKHLAQNEPPSLQKTQDMPSTSIDTSPTDSVRTTHIPSSKNTVTNPLLTNFSFINAPINTLTNDTSPLSQIANIDHSDANRNIVPVEAPLAPTQLISNSGTTGTPAKVLNASIPLQILETMPIISSTIPSNIEVTVHHYHHLLNENTPPSTQLVSNHSAANIHENILPNDTTIFITETSHGKTPVDSLTNEMPPPSTQTMPYITDTPIDPLTDKMPPRSTHVMPHTTDTPIDPLTGMMPPPSTQTMPRITDTPMDSLTDKMPPRSTRTMPHITHTPIDLLTNKIPPLSTQTMPRTTEMPITEDDPLSEDRFRETIATSDSDITIKGLQTDVNFPLFKLSTHNTNFANPTDEFAEPLDFSDSITLREEHLPIGSHFSDSPISSTSTLPSPFSEHTSGSNIDKSSLSEDIFVNSTSREDIPTLDSSISKVPRDRFLTVVDTPFSTKLAEELEILDTLSPDGSEDKISTAVITPTTTQTIPVNGWLTVKTETIDKSEVQRLTPILNNNPSPLVTNAVLSEMSKLVDASDSTNLLEKDVLIPEIATGILISRSLAPSDPFIDNSSISSNDTDKNIYSKIHEDDLLFHVNDRIKETTVIPYDESPNDDTIEDAPHIETTLSDTSTIDKFFLFHHIDKDAQLNYHHSDLLFDTPISKIPTDALRLPINDKHEIPTLSENPFDNCSVSNINTLYDSSLSDTSGDESPLPIDMTILSNICTDKLLLTNDTLTEDFIDFPIHNTASNDSKHRGYNTNENTRNYGLSDFPVNEVPRSTHDTFFKTLNSDLTIVKNETPDLLLVFEDVLQNTDTSLKTVVRPPMTDTPIKITYDDFSVSAEDKDPIFDLHTEDITHTDTSGIAPNADEINSNTDPPDTSLDRPYFVNEILPNTSAEDLSPKNKNLCETPLTACPNNECIDAATSKTPTDDLRLPTEAPQSDFPLLDEGIEHSQTTHKTDSEKPSESHTLDELSDTGDKPRDFSAENILSQTTFLDAVNDDLPLSLHLLIPDTQLNEIPSLSPNNILSSAVNNLPANNMLYYIAHTDHSIEDIFISKAEAPSH